MNQPKQHSTKISGIQSSGIQSSRIQSSSPQKSQSNGLQTSRRQLLSQGLNASLGFMLFPRLGEGVSRLLERQSLLSLATKPIDASSIAASSIEASDSVALGQDPITVTIHFTAKSGQLEALTHQLTQALAQTRTAPGCRYANIYLSADEPKQLILFKGWEQAIDQANYLREEQSSGRLAQLLALVEGDPIVEYWEFQPA